MASTDDELLALAEAATPGGASPIGAAPPPEPQLMGSQLPAGVPGSDVEGPVKAPWDNPTDLGVNPNPQPKFFTAEDAAKEAGNANPNVAQPVALAAEPVQQVQAPQADNFQAPKLRTGIPTMGTAVEAQNQAVEAGFGKAKAQADVGTAKGQEREANAKVQDQIAGQERRNLSEIEIKQAAQEAGRQEAMKIANKADEEYKNFKIHDFWADKTTGERLKSNIFVGLGAAGEALSGVAGNPALEKLKMLIDNDFKTQQAQLGKLENFSKMKREGVTSLENQYRSDMAGLKLKQAAATDAVAAEAKAQALRNGASVEQAENNTIVQGLKQEALQLRAKGMQEIATAQGHLAIAGMEARGRSEDRALIRGQKQDDADANTEIVDVDGNLAGHGSPGRSGQAAAQEAKKRTGNAQTLIALLEEIKQDVAQNGNNLVGTTVGETPVGSDAYKARVAKIASLKSKARVFSELPSSEGGLHLESMQVGGDGTIFSSSIAPENIDKTIADIRQQTNLKNRALLTSRSKEASKGSAPEAKAPAASPAPSDGGRKIKLKDGRVGTVYPGGRFVEGP